MLPYGAVRPLDRQDLVQVVLGGLLNALTNINPGKTAELTKQADIELKSQAHYWRVQYEQLVEREAALKVDREAYQATIRYLTQRLYGIKSEKAMVTKRGGMFLKRWKAK